MNKIVNVKFMGGILGIINSPTNVLRNAILQENADGYKVRQIIQGRFSIIFHAVSIVILFCTAFIYQPTPGYIIIFEKA